MNKPKNFDKARAKAFTGKVISDVAGAVTLHLCAIGDRLGLFKDLAENGPADPEAFAMRTGIDARDRRLLVHGYPGLDRGTRQSKTVFQWVQVAAVAIQHTAMVTIGGNFAADSGAIE